MKKILLPVVALSASLFSFGQITFEMSDLPGVGYSVSEKTDTAASNIAIPTGGEGTTWDYSSGITKHEEYTFSFIDPATTPYASTFPDATLAEAVNGIATDYNYFVKDATGLQFTGIATFQQGQMAFSDPSPHWIHFPTPFASDGTLSHVTSATSSSTFGGSPVTVQTDYTTDFVGMGYGTLQTPAGTYTNAVLIEKKSTIVTNITGLGFPLVITQKANSYNWVQKDNSLFLLMSLYTNDDHNAVESVSYWHETGVGVNSAVDNSSVEVFPTVATDLLSVVDNESTEKTVKVFALDGSQQLGDVVFNSATDVPVSDLKPGVYVVQIANSKGIIYSGRFVKE